MKSIIIDNIPIFVNPKLLDFDHTGSTFFDSIFSNSYNKNTNIKIKNILIQYLSNNYKNGLIEESIKIIQNISEDNSLKYTICNSYLLYNSVCFLMDYFSMNENLFPEIYINENDEYFDNWNLTTDDKIHIIEQSDFEPLFISSSILEHIFPGFNLRISEIIEKLSKYTEIKCITGNCILYALIGFQYSIIEISESKSFSDDIIKICFNELGIKYIFEDGFELNFIYPCDDFLIGNSTYYIEDRLLEINVKSILSILRNEYKLEDCEIKDVYFLNKLIHYYNKGIEFKYHNNSLNWNLIKEVDKIYYQNIREYINVIDKVVNNHPINLEDQEILVKEFHINPNNRMFSSLSQELITNIYKHINPNIQNAYGTDTIRFLNNDFYYLIDLLNDYDLTIEIKFVTKVYDEEYEEQFIKLDPIYFDFSSSFNPTSYTIYENPTSYTIYETTVISLNITINSKIK